MKQLKKYFNVTVMALLLSTILYSTYSSAVSAEFNKNTRVDSNSWTKMASAKKEYWQSLCSNLFAKYDGCLS